MTQPARMQAFPKSSVGNGEYWRMIRTIQVLVIKAVAANTRRWTSINSSHDGSAQHHVW
eukprot:CAMPEP_0169260596 /NCGR_PEP_ID=MMETSP1016-20121227/42599_1 /TAXON_ID=342587 /ORGANISM="Karlodinium micrum, Strain CCMP2283" /LENGTH=58 /DNA_ID=CAMNT_0009342747 /DNA_START=82 /DNA_END=255 /DNA_ORIENTATION=+